MDLLVISQALVCAFLAILFLQSGLDKIVDRAGNVAWLTEHFASSPLAGFVPQLVTVITVFEVAAGAFSALGVLEILFTRSRSFATLGVLLAALSILQLFAGQRLAKDYAGAAVLVPYFLVTVLGLVLLGAVP